MRGVYSDALAAWVNVSTVRSYRGGERHFILYRNIGRRGRTSALEVVGVTCCYA
jgi:hypothetical protein